jgi:hypothetical protein
VAVRVLVPPLHPDRFPAAAQGSEVLGGLVGLELLRFRWMGSLRGVDADQADGAYFPAVLDADGVAVHDLDDLGALLRQGGNPGKEAEEKNDPRR